MSTLSTNVNGLDLLVRIQAERKAAKTTAEKGRMVNADGDWRGDRFVEQSAALSH
jgi:hypothetical protein